MRKLYLGGPITGLSAREAQGWRDALAKSLPLLGWEALNPLDGYEFPNPHAKLDAYFEDQIEAGGSPEEAVQNDLAMIRECDAVLFNFTNVARTPSIGSLVELGYAIAKEKPVIVWSSAPIYHPFVDSLTTHVATTSELLQTLDDA